MIKLKQAIIVEGRYDVVKLANIIDAFFIKTDGFGIYKDKEKMKLIKQFAETTGIIVLTDSDGAGLQIRNYIRSCTQNGNVINIYIPDIFGKERRKATPSKEGKLGVEGIEEEILIDLFQKYGIFAEHTNSKELVTKQMFLTDGLIGTNNAVIARQKLKKYLSLPENISTNALIDVINKLMSVEEYKDALKKM